MKNKYIILTALIAFLASCTDKFQEFNTDTKNPATATGESLFSNAELTLTDQVSSTNVNSNVFKLFAQYWTETTYTDEANYDIINRSIPDNTFRAYYRGFLKDFKEASDLISKTNPVGDAGQAQKANKLAIIELLTVYSYQNLVDIFGDIPYSESMSINNIAPKYDDAATIYTDLINRTTAAVAGLDSTNASFGSADLIYGGNVGSWVRFGNSLKLKLGITLADVNPSLSRTTVEAAVTAGVLKSNSQNALLRYLAAIHVNPIYTDVIQSGRNDFVPANTIVDIMNSLNDPRRPLYFTTTGGIYSGGVYGASSPYSQYSHIASAITLPNFPGILLTYDEVLFYLAEAAARGYSVGGTPETFYNSAIAASITFWNGTATDVTSYLTQPSVAYATAPGTWQQKIGTQAYIAFYTRGLEGYTEWRRLDFPILKLAPTLSLYSQIPKRFTYPVNEQTLNKANYEAASSKIGGDLLTTKVFWDVK